MRDIVGALSSLASLGLVALIACSAAQAGDAVTVYKSPTCGCCQKWIDHLEANGFEVEAHDVKNVDPIKQEKGVPRELASCHTAEVNGYVIEGHVPAEDIQRLLEEKPPVLGLAVPEMPIGSPGMEGPNPESYDVMAFDQHGKVEVFSSHAP